MEIAEIEFRPVIGYEDFYEVSADGAVYSKISKSFRCPVVNPKNGYAQIVLCDPAKKEKKTKYLHRIVAEAWLEKPDGCDCINHKNENKLDNHVYNLEWCTQKYNNKYNGKDQRSNKAIIQLDAKTGEIIKTWESARKASDNLKINYKNISAVCRGLRKTAGGYRWRFE